MAGGAGALGGGDLRVGCVITEGSEGSPLSGGC